MSTERASIAVVTVASGRHEHLLRQREGLARGSVLPDRHVVVALDDDALATVLDHGPAAPPVVGAAWHSRGRRPEVAAARNHGARLAVEAGADVLVFLDVDCIPGPATVARYATAVTSGAPQLYSGPVAYLPPPPEHGYDLDGLAGPAGHPARPVPPEDEVVTDADHRLFWSLSFALRASTWQALGGFCEEYDGYGAEDTDLGQVAARRGVGHAWVGGAWAYHQYHPTSDPPVQHVYDIVRNAAVFERRWGWWPMEGWLAAFERRGLARFDPQRGVWQARDGGAVTNGERADHPVVS